MERSLFLLFLSFGYHGLFISFPPLPFSIGRILREQDEREEKEYEQAEIIRRRTLTDEERLAEDEASGRYQRPGSNRVTKKGNYLQRYYHKGAFYADEEDNDLHRRAEEYARAPTGQDKTDFASLPKVMQVKKFGFARYSTKYKGLSKEDTTDNFAPQLLPPKR
jgi:microfibrillar-associated protein 1